MRHTRISVYAYVRICIHVYAYWADANYAFILVRIYLSCTVYEHNIFDIYLNMMDDCSYAPKLSSYKIKA